MNMKCTVFKLYDPGDFSMAVLGRCRRSHLYTYINNYLFKPTNDYKSEK